MSLDTPSRTELHGDETVVLYPSFGQRIAGGAEWRIQVCGTVYEQGSVSLRQRLLLRLLQKAMKVDPEEIAQDVFQRRVRAFIAPTERGKRVCLRIGDRLHRLPKATKRNGRFMGSLRLAEDQVGALAESGDLIDGWLRMSVELTTGSGVKCGGRVRLLENSGLSVISDIDDTIKLTEVHSRPTLLTNTFLREYQPVEGMAQLYRGWSEQGATFHYVSSSPWQLYESLAELLDRAGFPAGTFHLRSFRLRDHVLRSLLLVRRKGKTVALQTLLRTFPRRRFLLVGDSAERDPEIYGGLARKFGDQVAAIFIRELPHRPMDAERCQKAFCRLPENRYGIFRSPTELPARVAELLRPAEQPQAKLGYAPG